jgi:hypothetical protein
MTAFKSKKEKGKIGIERPMNCAPTYPFSDNKFDLHASSGFGSAILPDFIKMAFLRKVCSSIEEYIFGKKARNMIM